jgi:hypothetical protein
LVAGHQHSEESDLYEEKWKRSEIVGFNKKERGKSVNQLILG